MYVAFDDTDSVDSMCTTYLTTDLIRRTNLDVIGYPRLVRLNPNIVHKTRGNGAVAVRLGKGSGQRFRIGRVDGIDIYGYPDEAGTTYDSSILDQAGEIIKEFASMNEEKTNPGAVITETMLPEFLYLDALSKEVSKDSVKTVLDSVNAEYMEFKNGRGIIGASSALGWRERRKTYELLEYEYPRPKVIDRELQIESASMIDRQYPETFNNIDFRNRHSAIFPSNRTPVVYGVRAVSPDNFTIIEEEMNRKFGIGGKDFLIYKTNQGTDDHLIRSPEKIIETGSYILNGKMTTSPEPIQGGHYFAYMEWNSISVRLAAFEPTKEFREVFRQMRPGDIIEAMGSFSEGTLKVEKLRVISVSRYFRRTPPVCPKCGNRMKTHGHNDFRCRACHSRTSIPWYTEEMRELRPGNYEVPVSARRHLSMPFKLESYFAGTSRVETSGGSH